jgi:D-alanyl-D-alanine carboxypeptidase (penicillin-binding protein 5/6)
VRPVPRAPAWRSPRRVAHCAARLAALGAACLVVAALAAPALASSPPALSAREAALVDAGTGQLLYGYGVDREVAIASTTKLMTALLTLERVRNLQSVFVQNRYYSSPVDSQIGLVPGDRMTVHDLLLAMLLPSADDAAEDLAYNLGHGSVARFVAMMNARAHTLGLSRTHYTTPIGLDTPGNYSSASDLATLSRYLVDHEPFFARAVALPAASLSSGPVRRVTNRNDLVGRVPWINGIKTGHTLQAGYVLIGSGSEHGMTLIAPVLGTPSESARDASTLALLRWGFANFHVLEPVRAGSVLARPTVKDRSGAHAVVIAGASLKRVFPRSARVRIRVEVPRQLAGPLARHARVGQVVVLQDGRPVARIPLWLGRALPAVSPLTQAAGFLTRPFTLVVLLLLLGGAGASMLWHQRTRAVAAGTRR